MSVPTRAYRIASESRVHAATNLDGRGATLFPGRWNNATVPMLYTSTSRALAVLETLVHVREPSGADVRSLPRHRVLLDIAIPAEDWAARVTFDAAAHPGWNAPTTHAITADWGTAWALSRASLVAVVPSVIVPEECNVLLNPTHPHWSAVTIAAQRPWTYDPRLTSGK